nr:hypothetical protein [Tanacetum cinerariifolium]
MEVVMVYGVVMVSYGLWWWFRRWRWRVVASGVVDLVDRGGMSVFGVRRKSSPEKFSDGGGRRRPEGGGRRQEGRRGGRKT